MARHYADVRRAQAALLILLGCVVKGRPKRGGRYTRVEVTAIGYDPDGQAYVTGEDGATRLHVDEIIAIEKLPPRP